MKVTTRHKAVAAGIVSAFSSLALAQPAEPNPLDNSPKLEVVARAMQARTDAFCNPALDGDKAKGELTNADVADVIRSFRDIARLHPDIPVERITDALAEADEQNYLLCIDKELQQLTAQHLPEAAHPLLATRTINSMIYLGKNLITMTPTPPDASNGMAATATAVFDSIYRLATLNHGVALERGEVLPIIVLHDANKPSHSQAGQAAAAMTILKTSPTNKPFTVTPRKEPS